MANRFSTPHRPFIVTPISMDSFMAPVIARSQKRKELNTTLEAMNTSFTATRADSERLQKNADAIDKERERLVTNIDEGKMSKGLVKAVSTLKNTYRLQESNVTEAEKNHALLAANEVKVAQLYAQVDPIFYNLVVEGNREKWSKNGGTFGNDEGKNAHNVYTASYGPKYVAVEAQIRDDFSKAKMTQIESEGAKGGKFVTKELNGKSIIAWESKSGSSLRSNSPALEAIAAKYTNDLTDKNSDLYKFKEFRGINDSEIMTWLNEYKNINATESETASNTSVRILGDVDSKDEVSPETPIVTNNVIKSRSGDVGTVVDKVFPGEEYVDPKIEAEVDDIDKELSKDGTKFYAAADQKEYDIIEQEYQEAWRAVYGNEYKGKESKKKRRVTLSEASTKKLKFIQTHKKETYHISADNKEKLSKRKHELVTQQYIKQNKTLSNSIVEINNDIEALGNHAANKILSDSNDVVINESTEAVSFYNEATADNVRYENELKVIDDNIDKFVTEGGYDKVEDALLANGDNIKAIKRLTDEKQELQSNYLTKRKAKRTAYQKSLTTQAYTVEAYTTDQLAILSNAKSGIYPRRTNADIKTHFTEAAVSMNMNNRTIISNTERVNIEDGLNYLDSRPPVDGYKASNKGVVTSKGSNYVTKNGKFVDGLLHGNIISLQKYTKGEAVGEPISYIIGQPTSNTGKPNYSNLQNKVRAVATLKFEQTLNISYTDMRTIESEDGKKEVRTDILSAQLSKTTEGVMAYNPHTGQNEWAKGGSYVIYFLDTTKTPVIFSSDLYGSINVTSEAYNDNSKEALTYEKARGIDLRTAIKKAKKLQEETNQ